MAPINAHAEAKPHRALSMVDSAWLGSHFRSYRHREFILFAILLVLAAACLGRLEGWTFQPSNATLALPSGVQGRVSRLSHLELVASSGRIRSSGRHKSVL